MKRIISVNKIACMLITAIFCFSLASCNSPNSSNPSNLNNNFQIGNRNDNLDLISVFDNYAKRNFPNNSFIFSKGKDYSEDVDGGFPDQTNEKIWSSFSASIFPTPYPNKLAYCNVYEGSEKNEAEKLEYELSLAEYGSTNEAITAFETIISSKLMYDTSNLNNNSYYFNGSNEGYLCIGIQGNDMAMNLFGTYANDLEKVFGYNRSEFNLIRGVGIYLKDNYVVVILIKDTVFKADPNHDNTVNKCLKFCDELGIKNPLTAGTTFDEASSFFGLSDFSHYIQIIIVKGEIDAAMGASD